MTMRSAREQPTTGIRSPAHRVGGAGIDGEGWTEAGLGAALVMMTLVAGLNTTFAIAVMPNLASADDGTFVATMQRYNDNPVFPLSFTVTLVVLVAGVVLQRRHGPPAAVRWGVGAVALYGLVLAVTFAVHLPLNDEIDGAGAADLAAVRNRVEGPWVAWNAVRALLATGAVAALGRCLYLHGRGARGRPTGASGGPAWAPPDRTTT